MTPSPFVEQFKRMKFAALVAAFSVSLAARGRRADARQRSGRRRPPPSPDKVAEAYHQFLLGHRLEDADDVNGAIAAYKRAIELDPTGGGYSSGARRPLSAAEQDSGGDGGSGAGAEDRGRNREANRVLGTIYAALRKAKRERAGGRAATGADENITKAIEHLEKASSAPAGQADPNVRATLARLYVAAARSTRRFRC